MRTRTMGYLIVAVLLLSALPGCDVFPDWFNDPYEDFLNEDAAPEGNQPKEKEPPGCNVPAGEPASCEGWTPTPNLSGDQEVGNNSGPLKPVGFLNTGTVAATVMAWTYIPLNSESPAIPSNASTVAFPGGNPSSHLSLPLGTYTWCYHWELGDINEDGMIEYAHAIDTREVTLDESDPDDMDLAEHVAISAPADFGVSYGVCGMDFAPYVVSKTSAVQVNGGLINIGHDGQSVTLRGPITVIYYFIYNTEQEILAGVPREYSTPETVIIPAGETWVYTHFEGYGEHPGDWNAYIWLVSIDK